jgi:protein-glutamine gamma-glutamyltransferase
MARTLAAIALPAAAVAVSWLGLEDPRLAPEMGLVVALAVTPALARPGLVRALVTGAAAVGMLWVAFGAEPWELLPFRDERVVGPVTDAIRYGIDDFYTVILPFDPARHAEMHSLVLVAVFGFVFAGGLLVALRRPIGAAAVTIAGAGWPATLLGDEAIAIGALALAAALSIPLVLRARSAPMLATGAAIAALVVAGAAWTSSATAFTREAVLDWESWDLRSASARAFGVRLVWDANYDGVSFPATKTDVLRIAGPELAQYWRASTLDAFHADRWFEDLSVVVLREADGAVALDPLAPRRARDEERWLEQRVEVKALVDDRLVAAGTPVAVDAPRLGRVFAFSGGVVRAQHELSRGARYRIWSYVPDPSPAALAAAGERYPAATRPYLTVWGRQLPGFGAPGRDERIRGLFADPSYSDFAAYRPLYREARGVAGKARSPYAAVLALEGWFRQRGGFRYEEQPRATDERPLVEFVTSSRAGYCQHFAGAMALMARFLGVPARVAVGFTSGRHEDGAWTVSDRNAHAWVEVWFPRFGWVPFDPTPGRGRFSASYSFASDSPTAVAALGRGGLADATGLQGDGLKNAPSDAPSGSETSNGPPSILAISLLLAITGIAGIGLVKWLVRRLRYLTIDPRRTAAAARRELESFLRDQGVAVPASATLDDLRRSVADELGVDASAFTEAASRGRFGAPRDAPRAARRARSEVRTLLRSARGRLSPWARVRGFVSLRSLRSWHG